MNKNGTVLLLLIFFTNCKAQSDSRSAPLFREDWKEIPAATPVTQEHVANENLTLNLYGPGADSIRKSHHSDDPYYIWSGLCTDVWAVGLKHKLFFVDLSKVAKVKWRSMQSGFRELHLLVKLADGTWLVSKQGDGISNDWQTYEFNIPDIDWYKLDMKQIAETIPVENPDLSKVDEIGFTDLMKGGQSNACSRLDYIEVYGTPVKRLNKKE